MLNKIVTILVCSSILSADIEQRVRECPSEELIERVCEVSENYKETLMSLNFELLKIKFALLSASSDEERESLIGLRSCLLQTKFLLYEVCGALSPFVLDEVPYSALSLGMLDYDFEDVDLSNLPEGI